MPSYQEPLMMMASGCSPLYFEMYVSSSSLGLPVLTLASLCESCLKQLLLQCWSGSVFTTFLLQLLTSIFYKTVLHLAFHGILIQLFILTIHRYSICVSFFVFLFIYFVFVSLYNKGKSSFFVVGDNLFVPSGSAPK